MLKFSIGLVNMPKCNLIGSPRILHVAIFACFASLASAADNTGQFPNPDRIRYDSHCLTVDGHDMFVFSGAFHYFHCPKELWRDRFIKIKEAGLNTVESYVAWNVHEVEMPADLNDYSYVNLHDLEDWLQLAESYGLNVIIRPGPYICAEWQRGGFPGWLVTKRPNHRAASCDLPRTQRVHQVNMGTLIPLGPGLSRQGFRHIVYT